MDSQISDTRSKGGRPQAIPAWLCDTVWTWHHGGLGYIAIANRLNEGHSVFTSPSSVLTGATKVAILSQGDR